ncbi:MAG: HTTM domain-containing protein [Bacteroidota bacterium]
MLLFTERQKASYWDSFFTRKVSPASLVTFRVLFGFMMLVSIIRFAANGWIKSLYIDPTFFFSYYGFEWIKPLGNFGMYLLFAIMGLSALSIMLGAFYRIGATTFFLSFTYVELIDKSNYLNHYYFVSIIALLLIFLPAHTRFSIDILRSPRIITNQVPMWVKWVIPVQLAIVYFFAGLAKLNPDWLLEALPLKIWLPSRSDLPLIGSLLIKEWVAYIFSWFGAVYDLTIVFFLLYPKTRWLAYFTVIVFHIMTGILFQIGMFPYIMIVSTLVFFPDKYHENAINFLSGLLNRLSNFLSSIFSGLYSIFHTSKDFPPKLVDSVAQATYFQNTFPKILTQQNHKKISSPGSFYYSYKTRLIKILFVSFFILQLALPFRYLLYPGNLFWTEEGYRFSWRVMLMEKAGYAIFHITDNETGNNWEVNNSEYLTPNQEKMMATQPDMILQFAHFLKEEYRKKGLEDISITTESYVALNGKRSKLYIDPKADLTKVAESFRHKTWILPFE